MERREAITEGVLPKQNRVLDCRGYRLALSEHTHVMGILNVTPDSFYDGGRYNRLDRAIAQAERMVESGANLLDIGGESSRPGAPPLAVAEELARVLPVVKTLLRRLPVPISVDTYKAEVARQVLDQGVHLINDISALRFDPTMAETIATYQVPVVLMHMKGTPQTMQQKPHYDDPLAEIQDFLAQRVAYATAHGIDRTKLIVDPGIGFGKRVTDNLALIQHLDCFLQLDCPLLVGPSRKSFIGHLLDGLPAEERLEGTLAAVAVGVMRGAHIVRVHDVQPTVRLVRVLDALKRV